MLPCKPDPPSTPDCKGTQASPNLTSGQKGPLPTSKLSREKQLVSPPDKALPGAVALPLSPQVQPGNIPCPCPVGPLREPPLLSPDPISPISLGAGNGLDKPQPSSGDSNHDDPITVTPPSQRDYPDNRVSPSTATRHHEQAPPEGQAAKGVNGQAIAPPSNGSERNIAKPARKSVVSDKGKEPPIHAALKKSSTLSANDGTQICIDITGDQETIEQEGLINCSNDNTVQESAVPAHLTTLAPFLEASEKWFPNFDPNLQQFLAGRAQQLAIHSRHFPSFNAALYLLSKGPWIPAHISVHVRQAALAAVGAGWSWVNQVPTVFPFSCFDASISLATLDDLPSSEAMQIDAVFAIYATLCGNLNQSTRAFLFTKYECQCNVCAHQLNLSVDLFSAAQL